ncbi:SWI/SNF complex subunit SWI3D-like isoform X1 [Coffea arabica]|uniref:SWI/SNF complex subunit SWI3D-like isoform X1 n=1 Tax=Coffea arabica TaxID=13443 RepID=A0A6P6VTE4_COFAR|nr:SWI/SNF complex subunit SWI3D-like isoform X1 [Coffea arabica]XP_027112281.1 SWI/SNF complex subunit SWI3D-like isoform X1 [Coffea arabica]
MEEKRTGTPPPAASSAEAPVTDAPASSRRRGGGQKRKASATGSGSSSTPQTTSSKRQAREKPPPVPFPPIHNGPLTRARLLPNNGAAFVPSPSGVKNELDEVAKREAGGGEVLKGDEPNEAAKEDLQALEAKFEADYEAIRSRESIAHVVPNHAGWFSWTKIHPLEEKTLPSFFSGKSESRTPEIYMEIRNWIMKKFHANPNTNIEFKDLSEISVGELDARQEVMEFLDYWGLINYHPFPKDDLTTVSITGDAHKDGKAESLLESLFRFESDQSCMRVIPRNCEATPSVSSGLFPESAISEELVKSEGVEYHCNSCSADCSRKRYHCQKQADFDLCTECFNNGKFGSDMSPSDFIVMEPAEAGGASGGNWTDQETLLLLEALELFKENWNEIAEHVATKTKAQCILHFVQMPIEDTFLDSCDEGDIPSKGNSDAVPINDDTSAPKDGPETAESKVKAKDDDPSSSPMESSKPEDTDGSTVCEVGENFAVKALTEAFEIVNSLPSPGERLSFAEAGNPVMTLVAFLVRLLEPNVATASARSSLKSISGNCTGDQLAMRHCFRLEDPPDEKNSVLSERPAEMVEQETPRSDEQYPEKREENLSPVVDGAHLSTEEDNKSKKDSLVEEERPLASPSLACVDEPASAKETNETTTNEESEPTHVIESDKPDVPKEQEPANAEKSDDLAMEVEVPPGFEKEPDDAAPLGEPSESADVSKDMDLEMKDRVELTASNLVAENEANKEAKDIIDEEKCALEMKNDLATDKIKRAAVTALSAAAVKAKLLAKQEEQQIQRLAALLIEKQLHKLETKLAFFNDMENVVMRVREQLERSKQRLFHERAQIIATRLGKPGSRTMSQQLPVNRVAMAFANSAPRPIIGMISPRPPVSKPIIASNPASSSFLPATIAGSSVQPSNQDQPSSVVTK